MSLIMRERIMASYVDVFLKVIRWPNADRPHEQLARA